MKKERKELKFSLDLQNQEDGRMRVVMFTSAVDDGKVNAVIKGMTTRDKDNSVPFIDAHQQDGSIVRTLLGRVYDVHDGLHNGKDAKIGYITFAQTEAGKEAELLYKTGIARDVSVGIYFYAEDISDEGIIEKSEISELSGVIVGADRLAKAMQSADLESPDIEKLVGNYNDIKPKIKQYRESFMSQELFDNLGLNKTGDETKDIQLVREAVIALIQANNTVEAEEEPSEETLEEEVENQPIQVENQQKGYLTKEEATQLFNNYLRN